MKLKQKIILTLSLIVTVPVMCYAALRVSGVINVLKVSTGACLPGIKVNEYIIGYSLCAPKVNDVVCFNAFDDLSSMEQIFVSRMVATAGDKVEIKDGVLYVNDKNTDAGRVLYNQYIIAKKYTDEFDEKEGQTINGMGVAGDTGVFVFTTEATMQKHHIPATKLVYKPDYQDEMMQKQWNKPWNADQFGPITIPADNYFVVSDNRHNAYDSRYRGCVPVSKHKYMVVW